MTASWHRVGMLIPSSNTSIEREHPRWMPRRFSFHFARLAMTRPDAAGMAEQLADMQRAAASLTDDDLAAIEGRRDQFIGRIQERHGIARDEAEAQVRRRQTH